MLIIGAKGFAKELLEVCHQLEHTQDLVFYDDISNDLPLLLYDKFVILRTEDQVRAYFSKGDKRFALGLGKPQLREKMYHKFTEIGGELTSIISPNANIGNFDITIGSGATILGNSNITASVKIGIGVLMYPNSLITHDCLLGDFVELSPGATVLGGSSIGSFTQLGANATVLPLVQLGPKCIVGAGAIVTKSFPEESKVIGIPARIY